MASAKGSPEMGATLHVLHPNTAPIAAFLRVGHTGHRKLEQLQASGRLPYRRFVFDACHAVEQAELLKALKASGCEIVLDPNFAEMATAGRFGSAVSKLPWANPERPWSPADFRRERNLDTAKALADFAVAQGVSVLLAPAHLIEETGSPWCAVDRRLCEGLRYELDRAGGSDVAIDYQLITTSALLKDSNGREYLSDGVGDLPIENVWLRTSGFGATATGAGTRHFIEAVRELHRIGRPIVADAVGGFAGLAVAAFGAVGGISHGVGQKESFKANDWKKPPTRGGGSAARIYVQELDRYFTEVQLDAIFEAKGGRARLACNDTTCCARREDMVENGHAHFITQRIRQVENLSRVPESRRSEHFLLRHLDPAVRSARVAEKLKIADAQVKEAVEAAKARLVRLRDALGDLQARDEAPITRSRSPGFRSRTSSLGAVLGRQ